MNIKMADFLFEDEDKDTSNQDNTTQDKTGQESAEQKKRLKFREPIDNDFMFNKNNPEVSYPDVDKILAPNLAKVFKELSNNLSGNDKFQDKAKNIESLSKKEKEQFEKIRKYADSQPLGLLDNTLLLQIFKRNLAVGLTSKIGRIHLNPFQMTTGAGQVEGATTADLKKYEKFKTFFAILVDELSRPVLCLGKVILFMMPAIEKDCSDAIDFINLTYPGVITKDNPFISSVDKVAFTLLTKEDFKKLQTNPLAAVKSAMSREKKQETNENFIYQLGLKSLLFESIGAGDDSLNIDIDFDDDKSGESEELTKQEQIKNIIDLDINSLDAEKINDLIFKIFQEDYHDVYSYFLNNIRNNLSYFINKSEELSPLNFFNSNEKYSKLLLKELISYIEAYDSNLDKDGK